MFLIESRIQSLLNNDYFWPLGVLIIINGKPLKDCSTKNYVILKSHGFCSFNFATEITLKSFLFHRKSCFLQIFPHCVFMTLGKNKTKKHKPQIFTLLICRMRRLREMTSFTEAEGGSGSEPWGCVTGLLQLTMPLSSASSASLTS